MPAGGIYSKGAQARLLCLITLPADLKNYDFKKKKKNKILPDTTGKILASGIIKNACKIVIGSEEIYFFETSINFDKRCENYDTKCPWHFFFCDRQSENFQLV